MPCEFLMHGGFGLDPRWMGAALAALHADGYVLCLEWLSFVMNAFPDVCLIRFFAAVG